MKRNGPSTQETARWVHRGTLIVTALLIAVSLILLLGWRETLAEELIFFLPVLAMVGLFYWLANHWIALSKAQENLQARLFETEQQLANFQDRLTAVLRLNAVLVDAQDEKAFMATILDLIRELVGASASSYVPLDEIGQPLTAVQSGKVPEDDLARWNEYLSSPAIRETCKDCQLRGIAPEHCPSGCSPLAPGLAMICLPLKRGERILGVINLYLPDLCKMEGELRVFLDGLLNEMALAVETIRLRNQEISTLRHLQLVRPPEAEFSAVLEGLLRNVQQALEADYSLAVIQGTEKMPALQVTGKMQSAYLQSPEIEELVQQVLESMKITGINAIENPGKLPPSVGSVLAAPMLVPDTPPFGVLVIGNQKTEPFFPRQWKVFQAVAAQMAVLVQNERFIVELEYRSVIEERTRLAREIHDGLAQTLAFLKMQASQMQSYLNHHDLTHLQEVLHTSYQTLSSAYLDARQAIDNLRVTPDEGLREWLPQVAADFEEATGVKTHVTVSVSDLDLSAEVQAQLIRVVQEALSNVRKHAHARRVSITLKEWQRDLILELTDDGQGFSPEDVPNIAQYGLRGMRERAELIGADFQMISQPHHGTTVRLRMPYRLEETAV